MTLREIVFAMRGKKIYLLGDAIVDEYIHGRSTRLSPEAPVPVFVAERVEVCGGGAANVGHQLEALGCVVVRDFAPATTWSKKTRYMVNGHQLLRVDRDEIAQPDGAASIPAVDGAIISDYAKGWCSAERCHAVMAQAIAQGFPVVVDPKGDDWRKYSGCSVICPNDLEAKQIPADMFARVLYKLGASGMRLETVGRTMSVPAKAKKVFDVTGAGDTVVAVMAAALAAGSTYEQAAILANTAAGFVVGELGTVSCSSSTLLQLLEDEDASEVDETLLACYTAP